MTAGTLIEKIDRLGGLFHNATIWVKKHEVFAILRAHEAEQPKRSLIEKLQAEMLSAGESDERHGWNTALLAAIAIARTHEAEQPKGFISPDWSTLASGTYRWNAEQGVLERDQEHRIDPGIMSIHIGSGPLPDEVMVKLSSGEAAPEEFGMKRVYEKKFGLPDIETPEGAAAFIASLPRVPGDVVQYAGGDIDELPMAQKGDLFLDAVIAKLPPPVTASRYNCTSHSAGDSISASILWDKGTPIAGYFVIRNEMNNSRLINWDGTTPLKPSATTDLHRMPDGRPIFGEGSPHDVGKRHNTLSSLKSGAYQTVEDALVFYAATTEADGGAAAREALVVLQALTPVTPAPKDTALREAVEALNFYRKNRIFPDGSLPRLAGEQKLNEAIARINTIPKGEGN